MILRTIHIQRFRNFVDAQHIKIEDDVTCLVGKNESGKTTILKALHRLKPANGAEHDFDLTTEYPRWRLARDRRASGDLGNVQPISAEFELTEDDRQSLGVSLSLIVPEGSVVHAARDYAGNFIVGLSCPLKNIIEAAASESSVDREDADQLVAIGNASEVITEAKGLAKSLKDGGHALRSKAVTQFANGFSRFGLFFDNSILTEEQVAIISEMIPSFFYFSSYSVLPGVTDLNDLAAKIDIGEQLSEAERTVQALLQHAGETPKDFLDDDYASRKAELQAASVDLSQQVFAYWKQNPDLAVVFDTDNVVQHRDVTGSETAHRLLMIELRDSRHGDVETNFSTRSTGFQWFFSFFAAFSEYQNNATPVIVLLDEPGTSLHGDAQRDFVRFIFDELGASQQTIYTTHSQHMVDPTQYEKLRAVHDRATRENPDLGVAVSIASLSADRATLLPIESALGYSVAQHLFLGTGQHLAVEGSSDFIYLQRLSEHLKSLGKLGLSNKLSIIPVGGIDNMPAFVALLGRRLDVIALVDGARTSGRLNRIRAAAKDNDVDEAAVIACSEIDGMPTNADIEDLFDPADYLKLYNWRFGKALSISQLSSGAEPILKKIASVEGEFDHALPAHTLTERQEEFFAGLKPATVANFEKLFAKIDAVTK